MNNMNFENFKKIFDSQEKCINILIENGYIQKKCCYCSSDKFRKQTIENNYMCKTCKKSFSIFKNTIFFNSSATLINLLYIIYLFLNSRMQSINHIAKETKRDYRTIDKALERIKKEFENQEIKEKFNFLLDTNINANINNVNDDSNVSDVNLSTATESNKNYLYYDLYTKIVYQYALLKHVKDTFATNKKYDFEYDFIDANMKRGLEDIYHFLDIIVSDLDKFFRERMSFIDKIEANYKLKNKEFLKLELFDDFLSWSCAEEYLCGIYMKEHNKKHFDGSEVETYDPKNIVSDLENLKNNTDEESKKEYLNFQEIINEAKKIIKIK